jgi:hypothetical protein
MNRAGIDCYLWNFTLIIALDEVASSFWVKNQSQKITPKIIPEGDLLLPEFISSLISMIWSQSIAKRVA